MYRTWRQVCDCQVQIIKQSPHQICHALRPCVREQPSETSLLDHSLTKQCISLESRRSTSC